MLPSKVFQLAFAALFFTCATASAQLTLDGDPNTGGLQNGSGAWNLTTANWWDGSGNVLWNNDGTTTAAFGTSASSTGGTITVSGTVNVGGMKFNSLSALPTTIAHTFNSGTIAFADNAVIELADNSSSGSSGVLFVNLNSTLTGNNLTIQREAGGLAGAQSFQYIRFGTANPGLTGTLTAKALSSARGIFLLTAAANTISGFSEVVIENGSVLAASGVANVYTNPISIAGIGNGSGAIRVDSANVEFSGEIRLSADGAINTNTNTSGAIVSGNIVSSNPTAGFQRLAATQNSTLTLRGTSTYTGATTLGRSGAVAAGNTILDFAAATAPASDMLYNGVTTAGALNLWGGTAGGTFLTIQGKAATANSQRFGTVTANGTRSNIVLTPGASDGTLTLALGNITRTTTASIGFIVPTGGTITTTAAEGLVGPWTTFSNNAGAGSWAGVSGGALTTFTGNLPHVTGTAINALPGYTTAGHLSITDASMGSVQTGGAAVTVGTVTMTDGKVNRVLDIGTGNTLRMGATGGIQIIGGGKDLEVGLAGNAGTLTGATSTSQLWLTNMSAAGTLTVNSVIANNGGGVLSVLVNGTGNTVLTGDNLFTGAAQVGSGSLEIRHSGSLGTSAGGVSVLYGAALRLAGGITIGDAVGVTGFGINNDGALRNLSGNNTLTGLVTLNNPTRINSDSGTLTFSAPAATNIITGTQPLTFGGAGNISVDGRIATGSGAITKDGGGMLTLGGDNTFTSGLVINAGILRVTHANAMGTTAGITSVVTGAVLELAGGTTFAAEPINLSSVGINTGGGIRNAAGDNTLTGLVTVTGSARIQSDSGVLTFDAASGNSILKDTSASARALSFGGSGDIVVLDPIAKSATVTAGALNVTKDGSGTLVLRAANTYEGTTTLNSGSIHLDFSAATSPASHILNNGAATPGTFAFGGGTLLITGKSGGTHAQAFGGVTINAGQSMLSVAQNGAASITLSTGAWSRTLQGGVLQIQLPTTGSLTTTGGADNAIISNDNIAYATVGSNDWAATTAAAGGVRNVVGLASISGGYTLSTETTLAGNADIAAGVSPTTLGGSTGITSLRFNAEQASTVAVGTGNILTTGGILIGTGVGANTSTISGGTLRSASTAASNSNADLVIIQNNPLGDLVISSVIANNATASSVTGLTKAGPGTLVLQTATHTYTGTTRVQEGTLHLKSGAISASTEFTLGSGTASGKIILGSGGTAASLTGDWLRIDGSGTANAVVGGATAFSTMVLDSDSASDFRRGFLGGSGTNENNLNLTVTAPAAVLQLGGANTYAGKTAILRGIVEVETLANTGTASSLGTGSTTPTIEMASQTTGAVGSFATAILRYTGSSNSETNRVINLTNSDAATDITAVTAVIENIGSGTLKFTSAFTAGGSNSAGRTLRLEGTNTGANEIVGIGNASTVILTSLVKNGTGTWILTGNSTYGGGTTVTAGTLLVGNAGSATSATGTAAVTVQSGAIFGGVGRVAPAADQSITIASGGTLSVGNGTLTTPAAGILELATSGTGTIMLNTAAAFALDLISRGSSEGLTGTADLLVVSGSISLATGSILRVGNPTGIRDFAAGDEWKIFDWSGLTGPIDGAFGSIELPGLNGGMEWDLTRLYSEGTLAIIVVPEPSRALLLGAALLSLAFRRRR